MLIVALLSLPFLYIILRRPVLRRLALRNAARRPRETVLVILGSLLGTAIMTGSFVVGDTFTSSIRRGAYEQLGPIANAATTTTKIPSARMAAPRTQSPCRANRTMPQAFRRRTLSEV